MMHTPSLKTYYQGILMGLETFTAYERKAFTAKQTQNCETILQCFERFKLEAAHAMELAGEPIPHNLPIYQAALAGYSSWRIQRLPDEASFSNASARDYQKGLEMMEKFLKKHRQQLPAQWLELVGKQISQTYALGKELGLLNPPRLRSEELQRPSSEP